MKTKICGMTRQEDLDAAARLGFDYCGFVFHKKSPRYLDPLKCAELESGPMLRVGVFVEQSGDEISSIMRQARLDFAQFHGEQKPADAERVGPWRIIRVLWPARYESRAALLEDAALWAKSCRLFLVESGSAGGGSGIKPNMGALAGLGLPGPWFLAGGLMANDVADIRNACAPYGLDFNSALEDGPGIKNPEKMRAAITACGKER